MSHCRLDVLATSTRNHCQQSSRQEIAWQILLSHLMVWHRSLQQQKGLLTHAVGSNHKYNHHVGHSVHSDDSTMNLEPIIAGKHSLGHICFGPSNIPVLHWTFYLLTYQHMTITYICFFPYSRYNVLCI